MAAVQLGTLDLSVVTDGLLQLLTTCCEDWPLWNVNGGPVEKFDIGISGSMPESVRADGGCQLCLYLLQVSENGYLRNQALLPLPPGTPRPLVVPNQPLALDLHYLLTAYADKNYRQEQRAMSIAVRCLYENPIVHLTVPIDGTDVAEEMTLQLEAQSADELGRVWQAFSAPFRLSTIYRVAAVFVTPDEDASEPHPHPTEVVVIAGMPTATDDEPVAAATSATIEYFAPTSTVATPDPRREEASPAVVVRGARFVLAGRRLDTPRAKRAYLVADDGSEQEVTSWIDPDPALSTPTRITFDVPGGGGAPAPGAYRLRVGSDVAAGDPVTFRSTAAPLLVAAATGAPANPPLLEPAGGVYTVSGGRFVAAATALSIGTIPLTRVTGAPGAGEFRVVDPSTLTFAVPAGLPAGRHAVQVRVGGIESPPAWWVELP